MVIKQIFKLIVVVIAFNVLTACDPASTFEYTIENNSSRQLILVHPDFGKEPIALNPGEVKMVSRDRMGSYYYLKNDYFKDKSYCPCRYDSSKLFVADTHFKLTKKITDCDAWLHSDKKKKSLNKGGDFSCTFKINDEDIK